jgi:glycosyltransferase involved in cell wall biosynthesis
MTSLRGLNLTLFFTHGVSLRTWDQVGMFEREVALYRRLQAYGVHSTFITYGHADDLKYANRLPGIKILCNRWRVPRAFYKQWLPFLHGFWLWQSNVIKTNQTDGADVALRAAWLWRKPFIARCGYMWSKHVAREQDIASAAAQRALDVEAQVFSDAQRVVVTTSMMAADVARRIPSAASRIRVIPNYVDTEHFCPDIGRDRDLDLIFIGRLVPQKNVISLLDAIQPLGIRTMFIGSGGLSGELQQRIADSNGQLQWQGNVPNHELPMYLNRARLFILPSHYEGHPKTLIEAMACGLPVIGADSPGIREMICHGETGWLCGTDVDSIRAAIQELLARTQLRAELGQNARTFAVEHFALDRVVEMELALLEELVG